MPQPPPSPRHVVPSPGFDAGAGLREFFLYRFSQPARRLLEAVFAGLDEMEREHRASPAPPGEEGHLPRRLRAALADQRYLADCYASLGEERFTDDLSKPELRLAGLAAEAALALRRQADDLEAILPPRGREALPDKRHRK